MRESSGPPTSNSRRQIFEQAGAEVAQERLRQQQRTQETESIYGEIFARHDAILDHFGIVQLMGEFDEEMFGGGHEVKTIRVRSRGYIETKKPFVRGNVFSNTVDAVIPQTEVVLLSQFTEERRQEELNRMKAEIPATYDVYPDIRLNPDSDHPLIAKGSFPHFFLRDGITHLLLLRFKLAENVIEKDTDQVFDSEPSLALSARVDDERQGNVREDIRDGLEYQVDLNLPNNWHELSPDEGRTLIGRGLAKWLMRCRIDVVTIPKIISTGSSEPNIGL